MNGSHSGSLSARAPDEQTVGGFLAETPCREGYRSPSAQGTSDVRHCGYIMPRSAWFRNFSTRFFTLLHHDLAMGCAGHHFVWYGSWLSVCAADQLATYVATRCSAPPGTFKSGRAVTKAQRPRGSCGKISAAPAFKGGRRQSAVQSRPEES